MPVYLTCGQQPFLQFSDRAQQQFSTAHLASNVVNTVKVGFREQWSSELAHLSADLYLSEARLML